MGAACCAPRHPCLERNCGCVDFVLGNYSELGKRQKCSCDHFRSVHAGLEDAHVTPEVQSGRVDERDVLGHQRGGTSKLA